AQINAAGIDERLLSQIVACSQDVVHFTKEAFPDTWVVVAAPERRVHHHDAFVTKSAGRLIIFGWLRSPGGAADAVAKASENPNDRRMLCAVAGIRTEVGRKFAGGRLIMRQAENVGRRRFGRVAISFFALQPRFEAAPRLDQRAVEFALGFNRL